MIKPIGFIALCCAALTMPSSAQDKGTLTPENLPPLEAPNDVVTPAKQLFGRAVSAAALPAESVGFYAKGCLAGGQALPINGPNWQVMRLSRNRNWANPAMIDFLQRFTAIAAQATGWPGLLVGDMSQPRGGPMLTGHASHQVGLDADIWLRPMPTHEFSRAERENESSTNVVRSDWLDVDAKTWTNSHLALIRNAASQPEVQRVFVNPAIKKALCRTEAGQDWMSKVRPTAGHNYHFHVRLYCPKGDASCTTQDPVPAGDGCDKSLDWWFTDEALQPKPGPPKPPLRMTDLPAQCKTVLDAD
jgi:penicillin-insensitive murein DD-endopeptidase